MRFCRFQIVFAVLAGSIFFCCGSGLRAEVPFPNSPKSNAYNNVQKMRLGQLNVKDKAEYPNSYADLASYLVDRLVHPPFNGKEFKGKQIGPPESIDTLLEEVANYCIVPPRTDVDEQNNQIANMRVFAEKMGERIQYVMKDTTERLEKVNAARMLAVVAKLPTDALADTFLKLIRDDNVPREVKLYLFEGLGNLLAGVDPKDRTKGVIQDMDKLAEICKELERIILMSYPLPKGTPENSPAAIESAHVIQFIRRGAVRALAQVKYSVIRNRAREPVVRPLWTLIRVASRDPSVIPGFTESEQIEAIIGICQMRPDDLVNIDSVAYLLSDSLLALSTYHNDQKNQLNRNPRFKPVTPWKLTGFRIAEAMKQWKANVEKLPATRSPAVVIKLIDAATLRFLTKMEQDGLAAVPDAQPIISWKSNNKPKEARVFKDDPNSSFQVQ